METRQVGFAFALLVAGAIVGCGNGSGGDSDPVITMEAGLEVATPAGVPSPSDSRYEWEFSVLREVPAGVVGPGADPLVFNPVRALPLRDGTLLLHDPQADAPLIVVDPTEGTALHRFGRNGQGPGELSRVVDLSQDSDGTLRIWARTNRQVLMYGPEGDYLGSERLDFSELPFKSLPHPSGRAHFVEVATGEPGAWVRRVAQAELNPPGLLAAVDLAEPGPGARGTGIQYGRALWTVLGEHVLTMRSERPVVTVYGLDGDLVREIRLPLTPRTLTESDIQEQITFYGPIANGLEPGPAALTNELYAANDSVFGLFLSGLWRAAEDPPIPAGEIWWRMFSVHGRYIGVVRVPEDLTWLWQGGDRYWAFRVTADGRPVLQELTLRRKAVE
jgi:hypothetical protein